MAILRGSGKANMKKRPATKSRKPTAKVRTADPKVRLKMIVDEKGIRKRVRELARQINRDYAGKTLHVVGILEDCFVFMADLVRALTVPVVCSFVRSQVRDSDSGLVAMREILYIPPVDAAGQDLLLVDGVLQSGITLDHLCRTLLAQQPASLRTAILIDKVDERKIDVPVDYAGFQHSGRFLVGYGLGYRSQFRNLPFLARVME
jgi:hypoxanthine phosphoribosyltransferase